MVSLTYSASILVKHPTTSCLLVYMLGEELICSEAHVTDVGRAAHVPRKWVAQTKDVSDVRRRHVSAATTSSREILLMHLSRSGVEPHCGNGISGAP